MQYTITGQVLVLPLNEKFQKCEEINAKYQLEIYDVASKNKNKLGVVTDFNNKQFSHSVNSKVNCVPQTIVGHVLLSEYVKHKTHEQR